MERKIVTDFFCVKFPGTAGTLVSVCPNKEGGLTVKIPNDQSVVLGNDYPEYFGVEIKCLPYYGRQKTFWEKVKDLFQTVYV